MRGAVAVVTLAALVVVSGAAASVPRLTVDKALRAADLQVQRAHPGARITCSWSARTFTYQCVVWSPSATATGEIVAGVNAKVISRRLVQGCSKLWPKGSSAQGCQTATGAATCWYAVATYSTATTATTAVLNVCRAGWQQRL